MKKRVRPIFKIFLEIIGNEKLCIIQVDLISTNSNNCEKIDFLTSNTKYLVDIIVIK
jgi:hypothetical protein